ncbi:phosphatidylethanolamine-binding protein [Mariannaea sp. PMI_226]|nr:phosphatidylethanolamine-binding protein [Mariannaea sp. PMI_226]
MGLEDLEKAILHSLEQAGLVPGSASALIPHIFKPSTELKVSFGGKEVALGNFFRPHECRSAPTISFGPEADPAVNNDTSYLIMLIDPDAPTPEDPKFAFWRHWIQPGFRPSNGEAPSTTTAQPALTEYFGPAPPDYSKPHRYLFLLFREPDEFNLQTQDVGGDDFEQRQSFAALKYIQTHKLYLVGLNWMISGNDELKE